MSVVANSSAGTDRPTYGRTATRRSCRALLKSCRKRKKVFSGGVFSYLKPSPPGPAGRLDGRGLKDSGTLQKYKSEANKMMRPPTPKLVPSTDAGGPTCSLLHPPDWASRTKDKHPQQHGDRALLAAHTLRPPDDTKKWCCG